MTFAYYRTDQVTSLCQGGQEVEVFCAISGLLDQVAEHSRYAACNMHVAETLEVINKQISQLAKSTTRFGVVWSLVDNSEPTKEYLQWFGWWKTYYEGLSKSQQGNLKQALVCGGDLSRWRPEGDWRAA